MKLSALVSLVNLVLPKILRECLQEICRQRHVGSTLPTQRRTMLFEWQHASAGIAHSRLLATGFASYANIADNLKHGHFQADAEILQRLPYSASLMLSSRSVKKGLEVHTVSSPAQLKALSVHLRSFMADFSLVMETPHVPRINCFIG